MSSTLVCLFIVFLLPSQHNVEARRSCARDGRPVKAKGHRGAPDCRYPYLVSIKDVFKRHICSGTLINRNYVLTSAGCVANGRGLVAAINGIYKDGPYAEVIRIRAVYRHPEFRSGRPERDAALVVLERPSRQLTVGLARRTPPAGKRVTIVGWGRIASQGGFSEVMQHRMDYRISPSSCRKIHVPFGALCAGKDHINICEGDHGGPLIRRGSSPRYDIQVGIVSKAVGDCSRKGKPGLFVDVAGIRGWIERYI